MRSPLTTMRIAVDLDRALELAMHGVVARQVRIGFGAAQIVHRDDLDVLVAPGFVQGTQDIAADAAVAVDGDADGHGQLLRKS